MTESLTFCTKKEVADQTKIKNYIELKSHENQYLIEASAFYSKFWANLLTSDISELEIACSNKDYDMILDIAGIGIEEVVSLINLYHNTNIEDDIKFEYCENCTNQDVFNELFTIVQNLQIEEDPLPILVPDSEILFNCLGACTLTCLPATVNPPAWAICMAACTALCYTVSTH